jgi:hypothetical protein
MDERILIETFDKITKQYTAIRNILNSTRKVNGDISIEICNKSSENTTSVNSGDTDKKQRMIMRMKHIERYLKFITNHIQKVSLVINDIPPYNIALEILEDSLNESCHTEDIEWEKLTEEVYNTLNIESDDEYDDNYDGEISELIPKYTLDDNTPNEDTSLDIAIESDNDSDDPPLVEIDKFNDSDNEELNIFEIEIDKVKYYANDEHNGKIYHILANNVIGKKVGEFNEGVATFY